jgi:hypothetical protein
MNWHFVSLLPGYRSLNELGSAKRTGRRDFGDTAINKTSLFADTQRLPSFAYVLVICDCYLVSA